MKRLQKCCCCASTRTGTLITATLGIILSIITIIIIWVAPKHLVSFSTFIFDKDLDKKISDMEVPRIILTINLCFTMLICALLIVAVMKRRSWLMLPWVVLGIVLAVGLLISILHTSITYYIRVDGQDDEQYEHAVIIATLVLVGGLIYLGLYLYLWAVVLSHYLDVRDEEERGRYRKAPYRR